MDTEFKRNNQLDILDMQHRAQAAREVLRAW